MTSLELSVAQQSRWLRKARKVMRLSVGQLATHLGVTSRTINAWENESNPTLPARDKFISYLILMSTGGKELPSPEVLINALQDHDLIGKALLNSNRDRATTQRFFALPPENRAIVALMVRSLSNAQKAKTIGSQAIEKKHDQIDSDADR